MQHNWWINNSIFLIFKIKKIKILFFKKFIFFPTAKQHNSLGVFGLTSSPTSSYHEYYTSSFYVITVFLIPLTFNSGFLVPSHHKDIPLQVFIQSW